jgi:hypothetical protein
VQLGLKVVDVALGGGQLVLNVLQPSVGIVKEVGLDVTDVISPHQLIIQLLDMRLQALVLLKELSVALLNVLDELVLGLYLVGVLLQAKALVSTSRGDLLKQGARVLGVVCREHPTHVVGQKLGGANDSHTLTQHHIALVPNGEQGDGSAIEARQVALTKLREGLVGNPIQSVIEVVAHSHGEPSRHAWVGGVIWDVHVDLAAYMTELTVWATTIHRSPRVAKVVQHIPKQAGKAG